MKCISFIGLILCILVYLVAAASILWGKYFDDDAAKKKARHWIFILTLEFILVIFSIFKLCAMLQFVAVLILLRTMRSLDYKKECLKNQRLWISLSTLSKAIELSCEVAGVFLSLYLEDITVLAYMLSAIAILNLWEELSESWKKDKAPIP